jgi:hypothetical protein
MQTFEGFVCWAEQTVAATVATEAVSPSDNVFLATHFPLDIQRTTVSSGRTGATKVVNERAVLDDFLTRPTNKGVLIMPVLGESGAGKSHLVRWVRAHTPSTSTRQVIYLPKDNTSLAGVVELLLMGNVGSPFDEIRADLGRLGRDMTQEALQHALLDKLAAALLTATPRADVPLERALVGEFGLRSLLVDPFFRPKILRPDGLIARRARHILEGRGESSGDIPMDFTADDLPLDLADIRSAAQPTQKIFRLLGGDARLQTAAHKLLQQHLDVAVMEATNLGVGRVSKAFLEIRRALAGKKEIVLLVEDFALVQGVQRDLLDAITETGERGGVETYAPVRSLMAVTSGYFRDLPPTVRTRVDAATTYRYELRVDLDDSEEVGVERRVTDLLGRYLNAARIGRDRLEADGVKSADQAPNACDECPFTAECHSGFGTSSDGYGLYPYNKSALLRVVRATAPEERRGEFNPRAALAQAIRGVLQEHADDIRKGQFPNDAFEERFPRWRTGTVMSANVQAQVNRADPRDAGRRQVLLQYWGDAPSTLINLPAPVHTAFSLPQLKNLVVEDEVAPDDDREPTKAKSATGTTYKPSLVKRLQRIEDWHTLTASMIDEDARDIRRIIRQAILLRVSWVDPLTKEPGVEVIEKAWPSRLAAKLISIEGASETVARGVTPLIRFNRNPENAIFFARLIKLMNGHREGTLPAVLRLRRIAEEFAPKARADVIETSERGDDAVVAAMRVSLLGAVLAGAVQPGSSPEELLSASVSQLNGHRRCDSGNRTVLWGRLLESHQAERGDLVSRLREAIGTAQGTGGVHAIDAKRALRLIRVASEQWKLGSNIPDWATKAARPLSANLESAVTEQIAALEQTLQAIRLRLPAGTSISETVKAVTAAFDAGERASLVPVPNLPEVRDRNRQAADLKSAAVDKLERDLARITDDSSWPDRLAVAAEDRGQSLTQIRDYLAFSQSWLDAGLRIRLSTPTEETQQLVDDLADAVGRWKDITGRLEGGSV